MAAKFEPANDLEKQIAEVLGSAASKTRVMALVELIEGAELPEGYAVRRVGVVRANAPIETVQAYGLTIGVDAHGRAAEISSEYGLQILTD